MFATLLSSHDHTFLSLFRLLLSGNMRMRPVQVLYLTLLYKLFGLHPLGYHIMTATLMATMACLLYLSLSLLKHPRFIAIAISSVYILLPNYSTDRIWLSVPADLSMTLCFLNLYALLRTARTYGPAVFVWAALSVLAFATSALAYEVAMPLLVVNLALAIWQGRRKLSVKNTGEFSIGLGLAIVGNFAALASVMLFKVKTTVRPYSESVSLSWIEYVAKGAMRVHFVDLGIRLPYILYCAVRLNPQWENYVLAGILALGVVQYAKGAFDPDKDRMRVSDTFKLIACGILVFAAGNAIFLVTPRVIEFGFAVTGAVNRVNIAASVGVAIIVVGIIRLAASMIGTDAIRSTVESSLVALVCMTGLLINNTLACLWSRAYSRQLEVLADIVEHIPSIPHGTTLVLDGVCPYIGPGIVFECFWDVGPALEILYHDWTLQGDVVSPRMEVGERGLATTIYRVTRYYPYSGNLIIYNFESKRTERLTDAETARRYFQTRGLTLRHGCSPGRVGYGASICGL